ncbi:thaumatin-like protein [Favolaschia claudopus]|uniref:Thaumatin-like protein n=1 Tax=Favolaschia claudopus TaxID=2862362 RepID=A0AAW0D2F6_9AGAR
MKLSVSFITLAVAAVASARTFTVKNSCSYTVWPAIYTQRNPNGTAAPSPDHATGWSANPSSQVQFSVPDNWTAGRIWGRTECNFGGSSGPNSCITGGCNGGLECSKTSGTGVPPASIAEFTLSGGGTTDNYDVSLKDGFNIPMRITNSVGCDQPTCSSDLNPNCPSPLIVKDSSGKIAGCKSACAANLDPDPNNSPNCCTGSHDKPATCPSSGVQYYNYFKKPCPATYAYAYDESSGALHYCAASKKADYTIEFCP